MIYQESACEQVGNYLKNMTDGLGAPQNSVGSKCPFDAKNLLLIYKAVIFTLRDQFNREKSFNWGAVAIVY
jgi:hypothetical protein